MNVESEIKAWRDIWAAGQGVGAISAVESTEAMVTRWEGEFGAALRSVATREIRS